MRYLAIKRGEKCRFYGIGTEAAYMNDFQKLINSAANGEKVLVEVFVTPSYTLRRAHKICDLGALGNVIAVRKDDLQKGFRPEQARDIMAELFRKVVRA